MLPVVGVVSTVDEAFPDRQKNFAFLLVATTFSPFSLTCSFPSLEAVMV
jgi:hypothetical protein